MASSLSTKLCRSLQSNPRRIPSHFSVPFCTNRSSAESSSELDNSTLEWDRLESESNPLPSSQQPSADANRRHIINRPLENGLDMGIFKAILVGQVGQTPIQKKLKTGRTVTLMQVGTGGIRNNQRPLDNEEPRDYANRSSVQWHRVSVYPEMLGDVAMKHIVPGSILYLEGNLETKIFTDPITGLVRRIREIAIRRNGRIVFLGKGSESQKSTQAAMRGVGYY